MNLRFNSGFRYLAVVPAAIAALWIAGRFGLDIPNQPGVLLLAVVYCAYRGGLGIGLIGSAVHVLYTVVFFSAPDRLFVFGHENMVRMIVIALVAPAMATMVGLLRREADELITHQRLSELALTKLNAELEARVQQRTQELVLARDAAERASVVKTMFLANVSHELRTPLNAIIGFSELMVAEMMGPLGNHKYRVYARDIRESGSHLLDIINDILDLSKAEAGKLDLHETWADACETLAAACRLVGHRAEDASVGFVVNRPVGTVILYADQRQLKQALVNLLTNAFKFTGAGGRVELSLTVTADGILFVVRDSGIGIPATHLEQVLEPFVQVDSSLSRPHQGTGLGLPLVKAIAELHGGRLHLASEVGVGTVATVSLPLTRLDTTGAIPATAGQSIGV